MPTLAVKVRKPARDAVAESRANPYSLPRGEPLRRELVRLFRLQRAAVLRFLRTGRKAWAGHELRTKDHDVHPHPHPTGPLPAGWPDWHDFGLGAIDQAWRFTPLLTLAWDRAAAAFAPAVGLDPDSWSVVNPHTEAQIRGAVLAFSDSMNQTTDLALDRALEKTREELVEGVVKRGEALPAIERRIAAIFDGAEKYRARRIAWTETSRAVHGAQEAAAVASGVVTGWKWLLSSDACPTCVAIAARAPAVRLGHAFAVIGDNPHYSAVKFPPAHPHCNCSLLEVLDTDPQPAWSDTLHQPEPATDEEHERVARETQERDERSIGRKPAPGPAPPKPPAARKPAPAPRKPRAARPKVPVAGPPPAAWRWGQPIDPDRPIAERIRTGPAWERARELAAANEGYLGAREAAREADAAHIALFNRVTEALHGPLSDAEKAHWSSKVRESVANVKALRSARDSAKEAAARETDRILAVPKGSPRFRWSPDDSGLTTDSSRTAAVAADAFLEPILAAGPGDVGKKARISFHTIPKGQPQRSHCLEGETKVFLKRTEDVGTAVHEWGHQIELSVPGVRAATDEFLRHRVGSEAPRKMKDVMKGKYRDDELGREDDFRKAFGDQCWYVGKVYRDASEIVSMGLEKLYNDPGEFAKKDPEYCAFILGILDGSLRRP